MRYSHSSKVGFTLIEVVVGLALMASVLVASLLSFSAHRRQLRTADARIAAVAVADELLEFLSSGPDGLPTSGRGRIPGRANWIWQTNVVGMTTPMLVPMQVVRFRIIEFRGDGSPQTLVSVHVMETAQ